MNGPFGADRVEPTYKMIELVPLRVLVLHDAEIFFRLYLDFPDGVLLEEEGQLGPVIVPPAVVLAILE